MRTRRKLPMPVVLFLQSILHMFFGVTLLVVNTSNMGVGQMVALINTTYFYIDSLAAKTCAIRLVEVA